jgi:microcin C transport system substrate-binding protein
LRQAGWEVRDGALRNGKGLIFEVEYLDSNEGRVSTIASWARNLVKLGINLKYRPVDFAIYQQRLQKFEFDMVTMAYGGTHNPGQAYSDMFGSQAADIEDSGNLTGIKNVAVDALIVKMTGAKSKADLLPACRALDRVIAHSHLLIPQWTAATHRIVYNDWRVAKPSNMPPYASGETWAIDTWWSKK